MPTSNLTGLLTLRPVHCILAGVTHHFLSQSLESPAPAHFISETQFKCTLLLEVLPVPANPDMISPVPSLCCPVGPFQPCFAVIRHVARLSHKVLREKQALW